MTAQPNARVRFRRAIERRALWMAEDAAPSYDSDGIKPEVVHAPRE